MSPDDDRWIRLHYGKKEGQASQFTYIPAAKVAVSEKPLKWFWKIHRIYIQVKRNITFYFSLFKEDFLLSEGHLSAWPLSLNIQWSDFSAHFVVSLRLLWMPWYKYHILILCFYLTSKLIHDSIKKPMEIIFRWLHVL